MMKFKVKRDSEVIVISGEHKGKKGKVLKVLRDSRRVLVEGVNVCKKCLKKSQEHPKGGVIEIEMPIHYSNVMLVGARVSCVKKGVECSKEG